MPADQFSDLLDKLDGVKPRGADKADARCPAHPDNKQSLSIGRGAGGRVLLTCHAGCTWQAVLAALGMHSGDAFGEPRIVAEYVYADAGGQPLYVVERWEPKDFRQRMANGAKRGPREDERVLYNLPGLAGNHAWQQAVYYVEGEKDAETLRAAGHVATTSLGGANKPWLEQYSDALRGRSVVIIADNDVPGKRWARKVAGELLTVAKEVRVTVPPAGIKDVTDLLDAGLTLDALRTLPDTHGSTMTAAEYVTETVAWLWPGRIPRGMLTLLEGDPGTGKSTITAYLIGCLTRGLYLPQYRVPNLPKLTVAMLADEDAWPQVVKPRLAAAGADLTKVIHLRGIPDGEFLRPYSLNDLATLRHDLKRLKVDVLVVDPLSAFMGGMDVDSHRDQHVRSVLGPLVQMAEEDNVTVIAVRHFSKGSAGGKAIYRGGGSIGFTGQARAILQTAEHPELPGTFVLATAKCNLAPLAASLGYHIEIDEARQVGRVVFSDVPLVITAQQLQNVSDNEAGHERRSKKAEALAWLENYMGDYKRKRWDDIAAAAESDGLAPRTVEKVRNDILTLITGATGMAGALWVLTSAVKHSGVSGVSGVSGESAPHLNPNMSDSITYSYNNSVRASLASPPLTPLSPFTPECLTSPIRESAPLICDQCGASDGIAEYDECTRCRLHAPDDETT
jgi:putative DNA primase/helicase